MNTWENIGITRTFYFDILCIYLWGIVTYDSMLKELLKNLGLLVILAGVILLGVVVFTGIQTNPVLTLSLALVIGGLIAHIIINKLVN